MDHIITWHIEAHSNGPFMEGWGGARLGDGKWATCSGIITGYTSHCGRMQSGVGQSIIGIGPIILYHEGCNKEEHEGIYEEEQKKYKAFPFYKIC